MKRSQRGFTLVEMLVSISVATLLIGIVYGSVRIGQRATSAVNQRVEQSEVMRIGWQFLHDALSRARPVPDPEDGENPTSFFGEPNALAFVADMPAYVGLGGLMRITLTIEREGRDDQLVLTRQRFDVDEKLTDVQAQQRAVLVEQLKQVDIAYFGADDDEREPSWKDQWRKASVLPSLIRINVHPAETPAWPELIASPATISAMLYADGLGGDEEDYDYEDGTEEDLDLLDDH